LPKLQYLYKNVIVYIMEKYPNKPQKKYSKAILALLALAATTPACGAQEANTKPTPISVELGATPRILSFELPASPVVPINNSATASAPAVRINNPRPNAPPTQEAIKERLSDESIRILECSGSLITVDNVVAGVTTAAHCYKSRQGNTVAGTGTPVYAGSPDASRLIGTVNSLIINEPADMAFGAFPGHTAQEISDAYSGSLIEDIYQLTESPTNPVYAAGYPYDSRDLQFLELETVEVANAKISYGNQETDTRILRVLLTVDRVHDGVSCTEGSSGSGGLAVSGDVAAKVGTLISYNVVNADTSMYTSRGEIDFTAGDVLCGFAIEPNPADNQPVSFGG
jgi:hypothetical protein